MSEHRYGDRDMARAEWQRGVGAVVMTKATEDFFAERAAATQGMVDVAYDAVKVRAEQFCDYPEQRTWHMAHTFAESLFVSEPKQDFFNLGRVFKEELAVHTFHEQSYKVFEEAMVTKAHFPLNIAELVAQVAHEEAVDGFQVDSLRDIATVLRRPDFQTLIMQSAFTRNGMWRQLSTAQKVNQSFLTPTFSFDAEGQVGFDAEFGQRLTDELRAVNAMGKSGSFEVMPSRTSSGCPVRHLKPSFGNDEFGWLGRLSEHYGVTPEELLTPRPRSVIVEGMDMLADCLEYAHDKLEQNRSRLGGVALSKQSEQVTV